MVAHACNPGTGVGGRWGGEGDGEERVRSRSKRARERRGQAAPLTVSLAHLAIAR